MFDRAGEGARVVAGDLGRKLARVALRSPKRVGVLGVGGLLVLAVFGQVTNHRSPPAAAAPQVTVTASAVATVTSEQPASTSAGTTVPATSSAAVVKPTVVPVQQTQATVAVLFVKAWVNHNQKQAPWLAGMRPYMTAGFAKQMGTADPGNVQWSTVGPVSNVTGGDGMVTVTMPVDTDTASVMLMQDAGKWLVDSIDVA